MAQRHSYQHMTNEALPESDGSKSKPSSERKTSELDSEDEAERASASGYSEGAVVEGVEVGSARAERVSRGGSVGKNSGLMDWSVRLSEEETGKLAVRLCETGCHEDDLGCGYTVSILQVPSGTLKRSSGFFSSYPRVLGLRDT